jgi:1-acyl-sn-glycerol-3-phosphate acyltransferase
MINAWVSLLAWLGVILGTAVFSLFGVLILWPASVLLEGGSGHFLHRLSRYWASLIADRIPLWQIRVSGLEGLQRGRPYVIVANHQSMLDILVVLARLPLHFKFISKRELFWIPLFGWHMALAGYIPLKRGDPQSGRDCLEKARGWLRRGVSVLFFPEGTRSPDGRIHGFKAGAFKLALEEKIDILPLTFYGTRDAVPKRSWLIQKRATLWLHIHSAISVDPYNLSDLDLLRELVHKKIADEFDKIPEQIMQAKERQG